MIIRSAQTPRVPTCRLCPEPADERIVYRHRTVDPKRDRAHLTCTRHTAAIVKALRDAAWIVVGIGDAPQQVAA